MKPSLLVLAAGMGTRYGGNKQLDRVGPLGQTIIDYSVYDAVRAGFGKIIFVIRKDIERDFIRSFVEPMHGKVEIDYVFQEIDNLPEGCTKPDSRSKPWGTSHAILVARDKISEPFGVINSDDFYGPGAFKMLNEFLTTDKNDQSYCIIGYGLNNTLSDYGHVNRGVCTVNNNGMLEHIVETRKIERVSSSITAPTPDGGIKTFTGDEIVSMNLWGFKQSVFDLLDSEFKKFIEKNDSNPGAELDIPTSMDAYIKKGEISISVLVTSEKWFGVTYREDRPFVVESLRKKTEEGIYTEHLW